MSFLKFLVMSYNFFKFVNLNNINYLLLLISFSFVSINGIFAISLKCVLRELSPFLQNSIDMHFFLYIYFEVLYILFLLLNNYEKNICYMFEKCCLCGLLLYIFYAKILRKKMSLKIKVLPLEKQNLCIDISYLREQNGVMNQSN